MTSSPMHFVRRNKFHVLDVLFFVILSIATTLNGSSNECNFPAIFNFGDSNSDTGGLAAAFVQPSPPYGETYFNIPAGRFSDGRLIIDFIANSFGVPFLSAYLDSLGANYSYGGNFASASATIKLPPIILPQLNGKSPFFLDVQSAQFTQFKVRTQFIKQQGGVFASLMPKQEYFQEALYTIDIGQNDLGGGFYRGMTIQQVNDEVPQMVKSFSINVKALYILGARSFWIHNTGPLGCLPYISLKFISAERDQYGCAKQYNEVAQNFNQQLKEAVDQLREELLQSAITYVDIYSVKYSLFSNPTKFGFEQPLVTCCGYGGEYNYNTSAGCGETIDINGSKIFVGPCDNRPIRVVWDGIHYTEAANKYVFYQISTGDFSDPPIPLNMACHKTST